MSKRALIAKYVQDIRASYWFLPTALALLAVALAQATLGVDHRYDFLPDTWQTTQVEGARATLALISQSMIGVAGVMFSITIVAVSFASGNFGPRLIGNFMRDRGNQWSLGILISTFVYSLLILRAVQSPFGPEGDGAAFVPHLSMLVALGLTAISVMSMIYFVHHIPEIINVSNISAGLGHRLKAAIEDRCVSTEGSAQDSAENFPTGDPDLEVRLPGPGYIQTWNKAQIITLADTHDVFVSVEHTAGDFVSQNTPVLRIWSKEPLPERTIQQFRACFAQGTVPTEPQNLMFIVDQLVEMVARAMSPGVNDPFTAINCINWLYVGLSAVSVLEGDANRSRTGRVRQKLIDYKSLLDASFGNIEPYVRDDAIVMAHLEKILARLAAEAQCDDAKQLLRCKIQQHAG